MHFSSTARTGEFGLVFYEGLLLTVLTLGLHYPFLLNETVGLMTRNTRYGDRHVLGTTNLLVVLGTLGIRYAWAQLRYIRYVCEYLVLVGDAGLDAVRQHAMAASTNGEGVASLLDVDADVGAGFVL